MLKNAILSFILCTTAFSGLEAVELVDGFILPHGDEVPADVVVARPVVEGHDRLEEPAAFQRNNKRLFAAGVGVSAVAFAAGVSAYRLCSGRSDSPSSPQPKFWFGSQNRERLLLVSGGVALGALAMRQCSRSPRIEQVHVAQDDIDFSAPNLTVRNMTILEREQSNVLKIYGFNGDNQTINLTINEHGSGPKNFNFGTARVRGGTYHITTNECAGGGIKNYSVQRGRAYFYNYSPWRIFW